MSKRFTPNFYGQVDENGKLTIQGRARFEQHLATLKGKPVKVAVSRLYNRRTESQNAWYWACVVGIPADHYGYSPEEMHGAYKEMFLRREEQGKPPTVGSTSTMSTVEFSAYVEKCRQWAAEEGFVIPDPNEVTLT